MFILTIMFVKLLKSECSIILSKCFFLLLLLQHRNIAKVKKASFFQFEKQQIFFLNCLRSVQQYCIISESLQFSLQITKISSF